jgi:hypothetical protein
MIWPHDEREDRRRYRMQTVALNRPSLMASVGLPWLGKPDAGMIRSASATDVALPLCSALRPAGAQADGQSHPLLSRFKTIDAARQVYPHAMTLLDEIDWCVIQGSINKADAQGGGAVHVPNTGRPYMLNRTLTVNCNRVTLLGGGSTLDFRSLHDVESAILFTADRGQAYGHERHVFEGFALVGPGRDAQVSGILFRTDTEGLSSRAQIRDCSIRGFWAGALFGNRSYAVGFSHVSIYDCNFCIQASAGLRDAGETISFSQCYFFNSYCLVSNPGSFDLKFVACSLDYGARLIGDNNGFIDLVGCRLEVAPPNEPPIHNSHGGRLNMFGGFFLINGLRDAVYAPELFSLTEPEASVHLFSAAGWNWRTTSGKLTKGPGKVHWQGGAEITEAPLSVGHP